MKLTAGETDGCPSSEEQDTDPGSLKRLDTKTQQHKNFCKDGFWFYDVTDVISC